MSVYAGRPHHEPQDDEPSQQQGRLDNQDKDRYPNAGHRSTDRPRIAASIGLTFGRRTTRGCWPYCMLTSRDDCRFIV